MKKIVLTLAAIAALSTAAFANPNRSWTVLDEQYAETNVVKGQAGETAAFAVPAGNESSSSFDRLTRQMIEQDISHN